MKSIIFVKLSTGNNINALPDFQPDLPPLCSSNPGLIPMDIFALTGIKGIVGNPRLPDLSGHFPWDSLTDWLA